MSVDFALLLVVEEVVDLEELVRVKLAIVERDVLQELLRLLKLLGVVLAEVLLFEDAQVLSQQALVLSLEPHVGRDRSLRVGQLR